MKEISWIYIEKWIIFLMTVVPCYHGNQNADCPYNINASTEECLAPYRAQMRSLHPKQLFMGVDVELVRSACTALWSSVQCARSLLSQCPESQHDNIEDTMSSTHSMFSLCLYPDFYEIYARNMNCYRRHSAYSEQCFEKFRAKVEPYEGEINMEQKDAVDNMCSDLEQFESCVQTNIQLQCHSAEAGELIPLLIHPAVHKSTLCVPDTVETSPKPRDGKPTHPTKAAGYSSDGKDWEYSSGSTHTYTYSSNLLLGLSLILCIYCMVSV